MTTLDIVGEGVLEPALRVAFPAVPDPGVARLVRGELPFELVNELDVAVQVRVAGRLLSGGAGLGVSLGEVVLRPGETRPMSISTDRFAINYRRLRSPARLAIVAEVVSSSSVRTISDEVYIHEEIDAAGAWVRVAYRDEERRNHYAGGDLWAPPGTVPPSGQLDWVYQGPGVGGGGGAGDLQFCLKYKVDIVDYGVGEDHHADGDNWVFYPSYLMAHGLWTAHGARYSLYDPDTEAWTDGYADPETGCFTVNSSATSGFLVRVYAEAQLGTNNSIVGFVDHDSWKANSSPYWEIAADPGASNGKFIYFTPPSSLSSLMGISSWTVHRMDGLSSGSFANKQLKVVADVCYGNLFAYGSCYAPSERTLWVQGSNDDRKFLVSHEVGHFIEHMWGAYSPAGGSYAYDDVHPACAFDGVGYHAMRSRELSTLSFREGMAHFISLLAYNDPDGVAAFFEYYKHHQPPAPLESYAYDLIDVAADGPMPAGGEVGWNDARCEAFLTPSQGYSVEQDWLRFFWDYLTDPDAPLSVGAFADQVKAFYASGGLTLENVYTRFAASLEGTPDHARWTSFADIHSVDYPE